MKHAGIKLPRGYRITSDGKVQKIEGFGLSASAKIARKKSKKVRVGRRAGD